MISSTNVKFTTKLQGIHVGFLCVFYPGKLTTFLFSCQIFRDITIKSQRNTLQLKRKSPTNYMGEMLAKAMFTFMQLCA